MAKCKVFSLGGLDEIGKNCLVVEIDLDIFVFDSGLKYLNNVDLGINSVIPDFSYLVQNKKRIRGVFLTKIETAKAYGISYLLAQIPELTVYLTKSSHTILTKSGLLTAKQIANNLQIINQKVLTFGTNKIKVFRTATNMPGSCGYLLETKNGDIVYTGSIVAETSAKTKMFSSDFTELMQNKTQPTLLLVSNVEQVETKGFTIPFNRVDDWIGLAIEKTQENLYIGCYDNDWYKIYHLIKYLWNKPNRPQIAFFDKKFGETFRQVIGDLDSEFKKIQFTNVEQLKRNPQSKNVLIFTGNQTWLFSRMMRLLNPKNPELTLTDKDYVLLLGENKFNTELSIVNILNELYKSEAKINFISQRKMLPMEGSAEDIRFLLNLLKPKYFLPFNAYHKELVTAQKIAEKTAILPQNIFVFNNGEVLHINQGEYLEKYEAVNSNSVFVDNINNNNILDFVIQERKALSLEGVIFIGFAYQKVRNHLVISSEIQIELFGITEDILKISKIKDQITKMVENLFNQKNINQNHKKIIEFVKTVVEKIIYKEIRKKSVVLPLIINN